MSRIGPEILRRIPWILFVVVGITLLTFTVSNLIPADPARMAAGLEAREEQVEAMRVRMGLDRPVPERYIRYLIGLAQGDLGRSGLSFREVREDLGSYFPATLELVLVTILLCGTIGVYLGTVSATRRGSLLDKSIQFVSLTGMAMPRFWLAILLQILFFADLGWFPPVGRLSLGLSLPPRVTGLLTVDSLVAGQWHTALDALWHLALPAMTLAVGSVANVARITRVSMLQVLQEDYVRTARSKGLSERAVLSRHVLKNAAVPVVTILGLQTGWLFSGAVLVEIVFGWPGIGKYAVDSIANLDYAPVMGVTLLVAMVFVVINLIVDLLYLLLDPRIRF